MKCQSCGKQYDYNKEESCPWCGAYNIPRGGGTHTCTAEEMDGARTHQEVESRRLDRGAPIFPSEHSSGTGTSTRPYQQYRTPTQGQGGSQTPGYTPGYNPNQQRTQSYNNTPSNEMRPRTGLIAKRLLWIFLAFIILTNVIGAVVTMFAGPSRGSFSSAPAAPAPSYPGGASSSPYWWEDAEEVEDPIFYEHEVEETFSACGFDITVHSMTQLPLDGYYPQLGDDAVFLAVDVSATLADLSAWAEYEPPFLYIYYNDWWDYALPLEIYDDYGPEIYTAIGKEPINFTDMAANETVSGTFVFLLTDEIEMLTFGVDEYRLIDSAYIAGHEVAFPLSSVITTTL